MSTIPILYKSTNSVKSLAMVLILSLSCITTYGQSITQFQQFNGRYSYTAIGNTLNDEENQGPSTCDINTQSSANLNLLPSHELVAALLYWSGSGSGDFDVTLNGVNLSAERTFLVTNNNLDYFAAYADVTSIVNSNGNGNYTLSNLDLNGVISAYCTNATNYGGWSITVIYEDTNLPLNQIAVFDGFEFVSATNPNLDFVLENINIENTANAKIGFLAWEGDSVIAINESLTINGNVVSNPPLNPSDNAFNSTNSYTNSTTLYNMDLDQYDVSAIVNQGDTTVDIGLTSGQDLIIVNNVITLVNSELPDATILPNGSVSTCDGESIELNYEVRNVNSTNALPANTPIIVFADGNFLTEIQTSTNIPIGGSEFGSVNIPIPGGVPGSFQLRLVVDEDMSGNNFVAETNEANNEFTVNVNVVNNLPPEVFPVSDLQVLDPDGDGFAIFDLTTKIPQILGGQDPNEIDVIFFESQVDAFNNTNAIADPTAYQNVVNPQTIYVRMQNVNNNCFSLNNFVIVAVEELGTADEPFSNLVLSPNPAIGTVLLTGLNNFEGRLNIIDIEGRMVLTKEILGVQESIQLDISGLKSNLYFVQLEAGNQRFSLKLIKQ